MRGLRWLGAVLALAWAIVLGGGASPAHAHSELVSATPAQGARLAAAPSQIVLTFSTAMKAPATVAVTAPDGTALLAGAPSVAGTAVTATLKASTQQGTYTYAFRAFSSDGHQVTGQASFTVGSGEASAPPATGSPSAGASTTAGANTDSAPSTAMPSGEAGGTGGFWSRHWWQVLVGVLLFGAAAVLELAARRSR